MSSTLHNDPIKSLEKYRDHLDKHFPGLFTALEKSHKNEIEAQDLIRQVLNSTKGTDTFKNIVGKFSPRLQGMLQKFLSGKTVNEVTKEGFSVPLVPVGGALGKVADTGAEKFNLKNTNGDDINALVSYPFENWSATVGNTPSYTVFPQTVSELQAIVQSAIDSNKRVRVASFRQSWSNIFSENNAVLVSLLPLDVATGTSEIVHDYALHGKATDFNQIEILAGKTSDKKCWARIGAGVTNEAFRIWSIANGWTMSSNVIAVENTIGGVNAPICHGAGIGNKTVSDQVREVYYVDAHAKAQKITDANQISAAAGGFGLFGVITHLTFELDKMTYAVQIPLKQDVQLAIPPPAGYTVPVPLQGNYTPAQLETALKDFITRAGSYYSEWFWFAYQPQVWVNCWNNTEDSTGSTDWPDDACTFAQWTANTSDAILNADPNFKSLPGWAQGTINGVNNLGRTPPLPSDNGIHTTPLIDGINYKRGTQNFPILDTEFEIPIPPLASDPTKPDWSFVQRAWWDALTVAYDDMEKTGAVRVGIEMRMIGGSDITMAPITGNNKFGTASIELISNQAAGEENVWNPWVQKVIDAWSKYETGGQKLNIRHHWAKGWEGFNVGGVPIEDYDKQTAYKDALPKFKQQLTDIGKEHGWVLADLKARFSNPTLDRVFFS